MKVLLIVAAKKYTGAAAVCEAMCRALRAVEVDARFMFYGGRNLERRLAGADWALPSLVKERHPGHLVRNVRTIRTAATDVDAVLCHLPHDHLLCLLAGLPGRIPVIRNYRHPRHLRRHPWQRALHRNSAGSLLAHSEMPPPRRGQPHLALPVPVDPRFSPDLDGHRWRAELGIPPDTPVVGMVGKLARGRGFELLLDSAARLRPRPHLLVVGVGEAQARLDARARALGLGGRVHWAGYQDDPLPQLYATMNVVCFLAAGSDHGHRAITEAQACGRPVVAAALPGVADLIDNTVDGLMTPPRAPDVAAAISRLIDHPASTAVIARNAAARAADRRYALLGGRLSRFIAQLRGSYFT